MTAGTQEIIEGRSERRVERESGTVGISVDIDFG